MRVGTLAPALAALLFASSPLVAGGARAASFPEETPFTPAAFSAAQKAGDPILVHVTAPWCTTCAAQKPIVDALRKRPDFANLKVFNVDFDTQKPLLRKLGVQMQSTLIVYKGARETGRSSGETEPGAIRALLTKAE